MRTVMPKMGGSKESSLFRRESILKTSAVVFLFLVGAKLLNFLKKIMIGQLFGVSSVADAFFASSYFPYCVAIFFEGVIFLGFLPLFSQVLNEKGKEEARQFAGEILFMVLCLTGFLAVMSWWGSSWFIHRLVPGFRPNEQNLSFSLFRIFSLLIIFVSLSSFFKALNSFFGYHVYASSSNLVDAIVMMGFTLLFWKVWGIHGAAWGAVLGALAASLSQAFYLFQKESSFTVRLPVHSQRFMGLFYFLIPLGVIWGFQQIPLIILNRFGSGMWQGTIASLTLSQTLTVVPMGLVSYTVLLAIFPSLTKQANGEASAELRDTFFQTLRGTFFILIPVGFLLTAFARPLSALFFQGGGISGEGTLRVANSLACFGWAIFALYADLFMTQSLIAIRKTLPAIFLCGTRALLTYLFCYFLSSHWDYQGLALGFSLGAVFNFLFLFPIFFRWSPFVGKWKSLYLYVGKLTLASLPLLFLAWVVNHWPVVQWIHTSKILSLVWISLGTLAGILVYLVFLSLFKVREMHEVLEKLFGASRNQKSGGNECPVCLRGETKSVFSKENQSYARCLSCGLIYQDPLPSVEASRDFYEKDYYAQLSDRTPFISKARLEIYTSALRECAAYRQTGRLLDIGSGYGDFLEMAAAEDWKVWGMDPSPEACNRAEKRIGRQVLNQTVESADFPAAHFDVITLWNVMDCMPDSVRAMRKVYSWLRPGGLLLIRTPNAFYHHWLYRFYSQIRPWLERIGIHKDPTVFHSVNYEPRTLKCILSEAGFSHSNIRNGRPTQGDPYAHSSHAALVQSAKFFIHSFAVLVGFLTANRILVGPTLMAKVVKKMPDRSSRSLRLSLRISLKRVTLHVMAVLGYLLCLPLWSKWFGKKRKFKILLYHSVDAMKKGDMNVLPSEFKRQLDFLQRHYSVVSLQELVSSLKKKERPSCPMVAITFDDGYEDNYRSVFPLLQSKRLEATIFLLTGSSDVERHATHLLEDFPGDNQLLQWDEIREMARDGISFGSHGESHARLKGLSAGDLSREVRASKQKIESEIGAPVRFFSYPYGTFEDFDQTTESMVEAAGYEGAVSAMFGTNNTQADLYSLKRIGVESSDTLFTFQAKLNGALGFLAVMNLTPIRRMIRWLDRLFVKIVPPGRQKEPVLLVSVDFPPHTDGVSSISRELSQRISRMGKEVLVIGPKDYGDREFDVCQPYRTFRVPGYDWGYFRFMPILFCMPWVVWRHRVSRVFAMNIAYGGVLSWFLSYLVPLEYVIFAYGYEFEKVRNIPAIRSFYRAIYKRAKKIVCCSQRVREKLIEFGVATQKMEVLYPAVDLDQFHPVQVPEHYVSEKLLAGRRMILTVGRLIERKGHDQVLRALSQLVKRFPSILYVVVGIGPEEEILRNEMRSLGLEYHVRFMGKVSDAELVLLYNLCEVFIMPSREIQDGGHIEGFGIVYLEANACGKPVIGGKSGGVSEAIRDGETGFLVDPNSPDEIAEKILFFLSNPDAAKKMGQRGLEWVRMNFDWDGYIKKAHEFLCEGVER